MKIRVLVVYSVRNDAFNGDHSRVSSPRDRGTRCPIGRRGLIDLLSNDAEEHTKHPPRPSPLPRGTLVKIENRLRGRGDNRKNIDSLNSLPLK